MLIPFAPYIRVDQRLTPSDAPQVYLEDIKRAREILHSESTDMWTDLNIGCLPERIILRKRFRVCDIQCGTTQDLGIQCIDQSLLIDNLASRDVGDVWLAGMVMAVVRKNGEFLCAEEMGCLRSQRK
jgi:hypothetical protein